MFNRYLLKKNELELKEIERDLAEYLHVPFVKCGYDHVNSHKHQDKEEIQYRKKQVKSANDTCVLDYIINVEIYTTKDGYLTDNNGNGGDDGEVHELPYFKGNGRYIVMDFDRYR